MGPVYNILLVLVALVIYFGVLSNLNIVERDSHRFEGCARWLSENTPEGSVVFNSEWDDFPELFFYNQRNHYVSGIEPSSLYIYNKTMYWLWVNISNGSVDRPSRLIESEFDSSYVFSVNAPRRLRQRIDADPAFELGYSDGDCLVYRIRKAGLNKTTSVI